MQSKLFRRLAAVTLVSLAGSTVPVQARDNVFWSIGIDAAPGISVGVSNARPVVVAPAPVYVAPQPVYLAPQPVYLAPRPVLVAQPAVIVAPVRLHGHPGKHRGWNKHRRHHRHWH